MEKNRPNLAISLIPLMTLVSLLVLNIKFFGDGATSGPNQLALMFCGVLTAFIGVFLLKLPYQDIESKIVESIGISMQANLILLVVGSLIGLWIMAGIVPAMIHYGLSCLNPEIFFPLSCFVSAIISLATGSSWSTTGTVGVALMGIGETLGLNSSIVAGSVISGAYFGDKMSPLSDTTNLAAAMAETNIFEHIRHMFYTSLPAFIGALILFTIVGLLNAPQTDASTLSVTSMQEQLQSTFQIGPHLFLVPVAVLVMVGLGVPALPALIGGTLLGGLSIPFFQPQLLEGANSYKSILQAAFAGFSSHTGNEAVDQLLGRGGMNSMLNTVFLILTAMIFGGAMEATGMLQRLSLAILSLVRGAGSLVGATLGSCFLMNLTASDQYLAIVVPGRMFKDAFKNFGLKSKNLSRSLEDAGTVTSVLVPWNSGGAYNSSVLGVATLDYLPFCFFNLLSPLASIFLASTGWTLEKLDTDGEDQGNK